MDIPLLPEVVLPAVSSRFDEDVCTDSLTSMAKDVSLLHSPRNSFQLSPKFIAPRHNGETLTPAVGESMRW